MGRPRDAGIGPGNGLLFLLRGGGQVLVVVVPGLVILIHARKVRISENLRGLAQLASGPEAEFAVLRFPAALVDLLVFPEAGIADAGLGFHIVNHIYSLPGSVVQAFLQGMLQV